MDSIQELREKCKKHMTVEQRRSRPWFTEKVTRSISIYLTWLFLRFGLTANMVSLLVFIAGFFSGLAFIGGRFLLAVIVLQIWYLVDAVDGEIARYHKADDLTGNYSDKLMHYVIEAWIFYSAGVGLARNYNAFWFHSLGLWVAFYFSFLKLIYDLKYKCYMESLFTSEQSTFTCRSTEKKQEGTSGYWLQKGLKNYSLYPNVMNIITFCVIVDIFWSGFHWMGIRWTALILIMISYSFFYPAACLKSYYTILKYRDIDREFNNILVSSATDVSND